MSKILGLIGTLILAGCAGTLGFFAVKTDRVIAPMSEPIPEAVLVPLPAQEDRELFLPTARPDIFYQAITDRPLFMPTRRPQETVVARATEEIEETVVPEPTPSISRPEGLALSGILGGAENRSAFVATEDGGGQWLRELDNLEGWTVVEIGSEWIVLTAGDDTFRLELFE